MRLLTSASIGVLALLLGIPAVSAQDDPKPRQEEPRSEPDRQDEAKPAHQKPGDQDKQEMKQQEEEKAPKGEKPSKEEKQQQKDDAKAVKESGRQGQGNHSQMANGKSGHIPDDQFKAHFGRQHTVVIHQPVIVEGQPRFQYSGYWFAFSDPWPVGWAYTDQCYIDYVDGEYFLFDLLHPGVRIALFVVVD